MHYQIRPIPCKPYSLNWLPERLIVSHYENNYGAAVRSLNAVRDRLAVTRDERSIYYTQVDADGMDLMLVSNFR